MNQHCVENTVLFGAGGHAGVIVDAMEAAGLRLPVAIIDNDPVLAGSDVFGIPVIGGDTQTFELNLEELPPPVTAPTKAALLFARLPPKLLLLP